MDEQKNIFVGRRKTSVARVRIKPGSGQYMVNGKPADDYFRRQTLGIVIRQPLTLVTDPGKYDVFVTVHGGGWSGQAGATRMALSRALVFANDNWRKDLKKAGFLTRDPRQVERKKYGHRKARKSYQFSKR